MQIEANNIIPELVRLTPTDTTTADLLPPTVITAPSNASVMAIRTALPALLENFASAPGTPPLHLRTNNEVVRFNVRESSSIYEGSAPICGEEDAAMAAAAFTAALQDFALCPAGTSTAEWAILSSMTADFHISSGKKT